MKKELFKRSPWKIHSLKYLKQTFSKFNVSLHSIKAATLVIIYVILKRYLQNTGHPSTALAWYINGMISPEIWLRRGLSYAFKVYGGNNPHSAEYYHPLIITDEPHGGFDRLTDEAQSKIRVLVGVEYSRRGRPRPTTCKWFTAILQHIFENNNFIYSSRSTLLSWTQIKPR